MLADLDVNMMHWNAETSLVLSESLDDLPVHLLAFVGLLHLSSLAAVMGNLEVFLVAVFVIESLVLECIVAGLSGGVASRAGGSTGRSNDEVPSLSEGGELTCQY